LPPRFSFEKAEHGVKKLNVNLYDPLVRCAEKSPSRMEIPFSLETLAG